MNNRNTTNEKNVKQDNMNKASNNAKQVKQDNKNGVSNNAKQAKDCKNNAYRDSKLMNDTAIKGNRPMYDTDMDDGDI